MLSKTSLPPLQVILAAGESYLLYCDCQPLPLFHRESFIQALPNRDAEVQFAILALTDRFLDDPEVRGLDLVETSRAAVIQKVNEGSVELSTLQALVILSLVDFTSEYLYFLGRFSSLTFLQMGTPKEQVSIAIWLSV